jgi:predicted ferric reductase
MAAARAGLSKPAKPKSLFFVICATVFALFREASNFSIRIPISNHIFRLPTVGRMSLILANLVVLVVLCFYGFDMNDRWSREDIAFRCGFVTIAQLPLIFLLAGKNNIVGYLTGVSHERLNWLHRWCARCMLFTASIHMGYFFADWAPYDYIGVQLKENAIVWKGLVAWAMLVWIVFSSVAPIRGWCYELFVLQHLVSFAVLVGFVYIHTPAEVHAYIWIPVALFWADRVVRALRVLYANMSFFHPKQRKAGHLSGTWACKAEFFPMAHNTTRIVIANPPIKWSPGQHVFLSCHSIVPLQSHPFTIASIPADGKMEFLVKAETGGTMRFFRHAEKAQGLSQASRMTCTRAVAIEGPYGCLRPLRQFDSVILLAGSTGATFIVPLLRDILQGWAEKGIPGPRKASLFSSPTGAVTRHVRFVWVVKSRGQLEWFSGQLSDVYSEFDTVQERLRDTKLEMSIYVTCDDTFTEEHKSLLSTLTAPNHNAIKKHRGPVPYSIQIRSRTPSLDEKDKKKQTETQEDIKPLPSSVSISSQDKAQACGPDGKCYCKTTIENENDSPDAITPCCCCSAPPTQNAPDPSTLRPASQSSSNPSATSNPRLKPLIHPSISVFSGRPNPRNIIRRSLEQACGESAVVVCGPQGLVADVKRDVCALSDERAVHKGTGAQGIYLHTESFGY